MVPASQLTTSSLHGYPVLSLALLLRTQSAFFRLQITRGRLGQSVAVNVALP